MSVPKSPMKILREGNERNLRNWKEFKKPVAYQNCSLVVVLCYFGSKCKVREMEGSVKARKEETHCLVILFLMRFFS